jgi:uncharacterized protein YeaO (DUF488 family)
MDRVRVKRIYELAVRSDGFRVLVDRLWPRGISKERAALDLWMKDRALERASPLVRPRSQAMETI